MMAPKGGRGFQNTGTVTQSNLMFLLMTRMAKQDDIIGFIRAALTAWREVMILKSPVVVGRLAGVFAALLTSQPIPQIHKEANPVTQGHINHSLPEFRIPE